MHRSAHPFQNQQIDFSLDHGIYHLEMNERKFKSGFNRTKLNLDISPAGSAWPGQGMDCFGPSQDTRVVLTPATFGWSWKAAKLVGGWFSTRREWRHSGWVGCWHKVSHQYLWKPKRLWLRNIRLFVWFFPTVARGFLRTEEFPKWRRLRSYQWKWRRICADLRIRFDWSKHQDRPSTKDEDRSSSKRYQ